MANLLPDLELTDALPDAPFVEVHRRVIDRPIADVWPACLAVTVPEIRTLGPLLTLRGLPTRMRGRRAPATSTPGSFLQSFAAAGFVLLRQDSEPANGRALALFGAVGKFWSLTANAPIRLDSPAAFLAFDKPGYARTVARLEAIDLGDGYTRIETETRVGGTDATSTKKFAPYWVLIRLPSGLIRRSWLAAIDRRVHAPPL